MKSDGGGWRHRHMQTGHKSRKASSYNDNWRGCGYISQGGETVDTMFEYFPKLKPRKIRERIDEIKYY